MPRVFRGRPILTEAEVNLSGGLNISADASQLAPNQVRQAANCRLTVFGGLLKRLGSQQLHASAIGSGNPVRGGFGWLKDDGSQQLLAVSNATLHTASYNIPTTFASASATAFASASVYPSFAAFRDASQLCVYIADGGKILKWDGTTLARSTVTPNVSQVWVYNQRLYGCSGTDTNLLVSGLNDGDDLGDPTQDGAIVPIRTFGESALLGGIALGASNLLFHRNGISRWTGVTQDDIAVQAGTLGVSPDTGTINIRSVVATETEAYFLSDRGFYAVNAYGIRRISTNLDPDIFLFFSNAANLCAVHNRLYREIAFYLPDIGFYVFNYQLQAWTGPWNAGYISPITHSCWQAVNTSGQPIVLVGGATGFVKQMDTAQQYTDNVTSAGTAGATVTMICQFRRFFFGNPPTDKSLRFLYILAALNGSNNAGLAWATNTGAGSQTLSAQGGPIWDTPSMVWDAFTWDFGDAQEQRVQASGRGFYVDLTFTDASTITTPVVSQVRADVFDYGVAHEYN